MCSRLKKFRRFNGSSSTFETRATLDLDILVLLDDVAGAYRETLTFGGWLVELFVYTEVSIRQFVACHLAHGCWARQLDFRGLALGTRWLR